MKKNWIVRWIGFSSDEKGATAAEYSVMLAFVLGVIIVTVFFLGEEIEQAFNDFAVLYQNATS